MCFKQRYNGRYNVMFKNVFTTCGLSILLHGVTVISLPGATSCEK